MHQKGHVRPSYKSSHCILNAVTLRSASTDLACKTEGRSPSPGNFICPDPGPGARPFDLCNLHLLGWDEA